MALLRADVGLDWTPIDTALSIRVGPPDSVPRNSFVRLRGMPAMVALSEGHSISAGEWAVSLRDLPNLAIMLPAIAAGQYEIVITLVAIDGTPLAERKFTLAVGLQYVTGGPYLRVERAADR